MSRLPAAPAARTNLVPQQQNQPVEHVKLADDFVQLTPRHLHSHPGPNLNVVAGVPRNPESDQDFRHPASGSPPQSPERLGRAAAA